MTRKEMKGPDKFQVAATGALEWAQKNSRTVTVALVAVGAAVVAAIAIQAYSASSREQAGSRLFRALDAAEADVSSVPLPGSERQVFSSEAERARAVVDAAARVRQEHSGSRAAATAALLAGEAQLRTGEWDAARASFEAYLAGAPADDSLRFAGLEGLARAAEGKGDFAAAAAAFERAGREVAFYKDRAALEQARVLVRAGKAAEAKKLLAGFAEEHKESPLKGEALESLARLGGQ
ncbi:MAG: tetratricopeptide repeat protein [Deltaproteobacteria bacterium]|nr:tetratricopeptide repeat protein [Deltaproteobacteria bacterium]